MPLFFFNINDNGREIVDNTGVECPSLDAARAEAIATAGEMIHDKTRDFRLGSTWLMHARDDQGTIVCELSFSVN